MTRPDDDPRPTRRTVLKASLALPALACGLGATATPEPRSSPARSVRRVAVVGAGAFGGWTALHLRRRGFDVSLVDAWGPGNARSSSGGETRVIRGFYGADRVYVDWVVRSFELWRDAEASWGTRLYTRTGSLWMFSVPDDYARVSLPLIRDAGLRAEELGLEEAARRFPQVSFAGVKTVFVEEEAGYLAARRAAAAVVEAFAAAGGTCRQGWVKPPDVGGGALAGLALADGSTLAADAYVFAGGPWLPELFPELLGELVHPSRQEVYYFGPPAGDVLYTEKHLPVWVDFGEPFYYGIPGSDHRGFKIALDDRGEPFEPTRGERTATPELVEAARRHLAFRFPGMAGAPLLEARVCQYSNSPDGHFLIDRHPAAGNVWIVGGGSGHGFKLSPALGEHVAGLVAGEVEPLPTFSFGRFAAGIEHKTQIGSKSPPP